MITEQNEIPEYIGSIKKKYYEAYFGEDSYYYLPILTEFENGKRFIFNVWAFFGGMFWQIYRRQYKPMLLLLVFGWLVSIIQKLIVSYCELSEINNTGIDFISSIIFWLYLGFTGNYFLMRKAQSKTRQILSNNEDEDITLKKLKKLGSGNSIGVIVCIVSIIAFLGLLQLYKFQTGPGL